MWTRAVGALLLTGTLAGCSIFEEHNCQAVVRVPGVTFNLTDVVDPAAGGTVRICAHDRCEDWDVATQDVRTPFITINGLKVGQSATVSAHITDATGATTYDGSGTANLRQYQPGGYVCQKGLYLATVRADADGTLTTVE